MRMLTNKHWVLSSTFKIVEKMMKAMDSFYLNDYGDLVIWRFGWCGDPNYRKLFHDLRTLPNHQSPYHSLQVNILNQEKLRGFFPVKCNCQDRYWIMVARLRKRYDTLLSGDSWNFFLDTLSSGYRMRNVCGVLTSMKQRYFPSSLPHQSRTRQSASYDEEPQIHFRLTRLQPGLHLPSRYHYAKPCIIFTSS